ncbi:MAG: DUF2330 domain-containing protein [Myxococcales bacterium]|nr:DUF2330 domain-containing protein [Myxococcales bacterium]
MRLRTTIFALGLTLAGVTGFNLHDARACGGCFHAATDTSTSFVTDHRMVLSVSTTQSVLWDQVKYTGDPSEFAWVLPVREGAQVELAQDAWIETLDVATRPSVKGPDVSCGGGGGGGGCGLSMSSMDTAASGAAAPNGDGNFTSGAGVEVVSQKVIGPYESVVIRSSRGDAIHLWLRINGFAVPDSIQPILGRYTTEGFDFLALKLRPNAGTRAMRPVRVVFPGASATLPLRMVAAGIGAKVGLTLFVITEGRYRPKNFPEVFVDRDSLAWNFNEKRSNYRELAEAALARGGDRGWLTEYAGKPFDRATRPTLGPTYQPTVGGAALSGPLDDVYTAACRRVPESPACAPRPFVTVNPVDAATPDDAGVAQAGDASADASDDAAASPVDGGHAADASTVVDANTDARGDANVKGGASSPAECVSPCEEFDDAEVALLGLHRSDVWVTRMRAELSGEACAAADLELEPSPEQTPLPAVLKTDKFTDPNVDPCAGIAANDSGGGCACRSTSQSTGAVPALLGVLGVLGILRGAKRRRR